MWCPADAEGGTDPKVRRLGSDEVTKLMTARGQCTVNWCAAGDTGAQWYNQNGRALGRMPGFKFNGSSRGKILWEKVNKF